MVTASCEADADAWNSATGSRPTAQKAHRDRVARRIASQTIATYTASAARREPRAPSRRCRRPRPRPRGSPPPGAGTAPAIRRSRRSRSAARDRPGTPGSRGSDTGVVPVDGLPSRRALCSSTMRPSRSTPRTTSGGMHAPLNSEPSGCNGRRRPVEIWYERKKWAGSSMPPKWGTTHARYAPTTVATTRKVIAGSVTQRRSRPVVGGVGGQRGSTLAVEVDGRGGGSQSLVRRPKRPTPCKRFWKFEGKEAGRSGVSPFVHGSRPGAVGPSRRSWRRPPRRRPARRPRRPGGPGLRARQPPLTPSDARSGRRAAVRSTPTEPTGGSTAVTGATADVWEVLSTARTIRRFTDEPVDDATLIRCLEAAAWAPSGANAQCWRFIVLRSPEAAGRRWPQAAARALEVIEPVYGMSRPAEDDQSRRAAQQPGDLPAP